MHGTNDTTLTRIDSLKLKVVSSKGSQKTDYLLALAREILSQDPNTGLSYARNALENAKQANYDNGIARALNRIGSAYIYLNVFDSALIFLNESLEISMKLEYDQGVANAYSNIGLIYDYLGNYNKALENYLNSLKIEEKLENISGIAGSLNNIGNIYCQLNDHEKALQYYQKALRLNQQIENNYGVAQLFNNIGAVYKEKNELDKSLLYFQSALVINKEMDNLQGIAACYNNLGNIYFQQKEFDEALENYNQSVTYSKMLNDLWSQANTYRNIGGLYLQKDQPDKALDYLEKTLKIAKNIQARELTSKTYHAISEVYIQKQNYREAFNYFQKHSMLKDSIHNIETNVKIAELEMGYEVEKEIEQHLKENEIQRLKIERSQRTNYFFISLLLLVVVLIAFVYSRYRLKNRLNKELETKNNEINVKNNQLKDFNNKLETKVSERTKNLEEEIKERKKIDVELKKALKNAEDANYLKNAFLANMSHEIRTPLNGIIGFSSLLETELSLMENQELYEYANGIQQSGERLLHLLNNIIDISRIEANDLEVNLQPCNVPSIIKNVSELFSFKANDKGIKFNTKIHEELPGIMADEPQLTKVLSDIIDNAIKYTEKGFINVVAEYDDIKNKINIIVKDTGIGIDPSYIKHIFEAFRQESLGYSRNYQGAGLGLPLAKRLIELMNGEINIDSEKGLGTTVTLIFNTDVKPVEKTEAEVKTPEAKTTLLKQDLKIFIVEDDRMNRLVLTKMLSKTADVVTAVDGDETMKIIRSYYKKGVIFDIMLFDINLPAPWDGIKLMYAIKEEFSEYRKIPFIAQTA
jgi:signal transduction histidine kinase